MTCRSALVTGATGFIATELVKQLLEKGYNVYGSVRDLQSEGSQFLRDLADCFPGTLELFQADVMVPNAFDQHVAKVDFLFHLASPLMFHASDPQKEIVDVAVIGTENVLNSVVKNGSRIRRVILTSGTLALRSPYVVDGNIVTVRDWNGTCTLENNPYGLSKVLQEKLAWDMAGRHGVDLVSVLPSLTLGPFLSPVEDGLCLRVVLKAFLSAPSSPFFNICDIRDVCKAHILAAEVPHAHNRYIVSFSGREENQSGLEAVCRQFPEYGLDPELKRDLSSKFDVRNTQEELNLRLLHPKSTWADSIRTALQMKLV